MSQFKHIVAKDALELIEAGATICDIRDPQSFEANHIKGAFNLNNANLQEFIDNNEFDSNVLVCCYHGMSSQSAAAFLCDRGFEKVYSLDGGFERWALAFPEHCERS